MKKATQNILLTLVTLFCLAVTIWQATLFFDILQDIISGAQTLPMPKALEQAFSLYCGFGAGGLISTILCTVILIKSNLKKTS